MAKPAYAFLEPYSLSLSPLDFGDFLLVSKAKGRREDLLFLGIINPRKSLNSLKEDVLDLVSEYSYLDPIEVRATLTLPQKKVMTFHLLQTQKNWHLNARSPLEVTAWRYASLISWGESAAAKVLADEEGIPVRTMHSRLRLAREKGFLDSPGSGARLGGD